MDVDWLNWWFFIHCGTTGANCGLCSHMGRIMGRWVSNRMFSFQANSNSESYSHIDNYNESESRAWYCALLSATGLQYTLAIVGTVLLYIYYDCALNKFFITINLVLCIVVSVVSILPQVQEKFPRSGLLQSSVVTLYAIYLTWSALSNNPDLKCHTEFFPPDAKNKVRQWFYIRSVSDQLIDLFNRR